MNISRQGWLLFWGVLACGFLAGAEDYIYNPRDATDAGDAPRLVVPDPDAKGGTAQAAVPGKSKPGSYTAALYAYARPAAAYKVTWRLKFDDNTIPGVVVKVWTSDEQGRGTFKRGSLEIKGTDFKAPNAYQEFTYTAEKAEGGFFNVGAVWQGKGRLHIDEIRIIPEKVYTEKEIMAHLGPVELPQSWCLRPPTPPVVHLGKGLWWNFFGLSEATAELGGAVISSSYHTIGQYGTSLRNFPATWQDFAACNLIVLANVDAQALGPKGRLLLEEYVNGGGALLVLGGPRAFECGTYQDTAMARLLPCELLGKDRTKTAGGLVLKPGPGAKGILPDDLAWGMEPRAFFTHEVKPKAGAQVLVLAGDRPVLVAWPVGKGRVAAFAVTAEGEAGADQLAFWEWGDQPRLVAAVSRWLMAGQGAGASAGGSEETRKLLNELLAPATADETVKRQQAMQVLLGMCSDRAFARNLLDAAATYEGTPDRAFVNTLARAVQPFVNAEFAKEAGDLVHSGNTGKAALGLQVLGMSRAPDAKAVLLKVLDRGGAALKAASGDDEVKMDDLMAATTGGDMGDDQRLKLAAVIGLGDLGDSSVQERLRQVSATFSVKKTAGANTGEVEDLNENIVQQTLAARLRLGDAKAVGLYIDEMLKNATEMEMHINYLDVMLRDANDKELMRGTKVATVRLPIMRQRQALCLDMLRQTPVSVYAAVAAELARRDDERIIPYAYAALAARPGKVVSAEIARSFLPVVEGSPFPELRRLAFNVVLSCGDAGAVSELGAVLAKLAAGQDAGSVTFALRQVGRLPGPARAAVIAAAMKHPAANVHRLALAAQRLPPG